QPFGKACEITDERLLRLTEPRIDAGLICAPGQTQPELYKKLSEFCGTRDPEGERFCFALLDAPLKNPVDGAPTQGEEVDAHSAASYWPWVSKQAKPDDRDSVENYFPPSAYVAGIYARTDTDVGVHYAPAGLDKVLARASGLSEYFSEKRAGELN